MEDDCRHHQGEVSSSTAPEGCSSLPWTTLPCLAPPCHRPPYLETREKWTAKISSEPAFNPAPDPWALLYNSNCAASTKEGWTCSWAALRPNWLRQKWPKIPSDLPRARSHRPESGWGPGGSFAFLASYKLSFLLCWLHHEHRTRLAGPHIAGLRHLRRSWRRAEARNRVNEARNFGPTHPGESLEGCCLCQDGLSFTTHNGVQS